MDPLTTDQMCFVKEPAQMIDLTFSVWRFEKAFEKNLLTANVWIESVVD